MASFVEAAYIILKDEGKPLKVRDIIEKAAATKLITLGKGKKPTETLRAAMYLENKRKLEQKKYPRFRRLYDGSWEINS